jgi:hypothetical protein
MLNVSGGRGEGNWRTSLPRRSQPNAWEITRTRRGGEGERNERASVELVDVETSQGGNVCHHSTSLVRHVP